MASLSLSRLEVASSRIRIFGLARIARAIATRCRWPPDSRTPRSPTIVSYPFSNPSTNSSQCAMRLTALISSRDACGLAYAMFSATVPSKRKLSCSTTPRCSR